MTKRLAYLLLFLGAVFVVLHIYTPSRKQTLGAPAIEFQARVDTGAAVTSIDLGPEGVEIEGEEETPEQNVGKPIRFQLRNRQGQEAWQEATIEGVLVVRTAHGSAPRYLVKLPLECEGVSKVIGITLGERDVMDYLLLLGRDFLEEDFVVDVSDPGPGQGSRQSKAR